MAKKESEMKRKTKFQKVMELHREKRIVYTYSTYLIHKINAFYRTKTGNDEREKIYEK